MKFSRVLSVGLIVLLFLSLLAGCEEPVPATPTPTTTDSPEEVIEAVTPAEMSKPEVVPEPEEPISAPEPEPEQEVAAEPQHSQAYEHLHSLFKDSAFYDLADTEALAPYYEMAAARKEAILNSPTEIVKSDTFIPGETYTGTAYYVSPNGSDYNDGLSPETAWRDIYMVNDADLHEGDAVFFERGGVYRLLGDRLNLADGVTYSAYGEGAKPVITLSQENSARAECWELYYEGANGEKIWKFYQDLGEVGGVIFDDETYAARVYELPTTDGWMALDVLNLDPANGIYDPNDPCGFWKVVTTGTYPTIEEALTEDMTFVTRVDLTDVSFPTGFGEWRVYGGLYLRCDSGNPGELFSSINIISRREGYGMDGILLDGTMAKGYVLDNLSLKYCTGPIAGSFTESGDEMIQNCTFEWGGPVLLDVQTPDTFDGGYFVASDGLYNVANNTTIRNNYFRQVGNGPTFESSEAVPDSMGTYTVEGNLIENCAQGIRTYLLEEEGAFDAIILRDNIILNSGDSMNNGCFEEPTAIDLGATDCQFYKEIEISENVLIGSTAAMIRLSRPDRFQYDFHDNVIAQDKDGLVLTECNDGVEWFWMKDALE